MDWRVKKKYSNKQIRAIQEALSEISIEYRKRFMKAKDVSYANQQKIMFDVVCDIQGKYDCYCGYIGELLWKKTK